MGNLSVHRHPLSGKSTGVWRNGEDFSVGDMKGKRRPNSIAANMDPNFDSLTAALRQMHDSIANEPIPDDFLDLLDQIDAKMSASKKFS